ncbi:TrkH family potassium uptake protein [Paracoccaceae bacterium]|nr:TrkH family potassium uptake protein [Paracoccaceae bacterium]
MLNVRPIGFIVGILVVILGISMVLPLLADLYFQDQHWKIFAYSSFFTIVVGALLVLSCLNSFPTSFSIQQTFLLTVVIWFVLPIFGAIPFLIGWTNASFIDSFFEAMSGMTTTGATVFSGLDMFPEGLLLWRGLLQWFGGIGIIVVAVVFLPLLRVGGMQMFQMDSFSNFGQSLPKVKEIAQSVFLIYLALTCLAVLAYLASGLRLFDSVVHAMTTISTGGFGNYDDSFANFPASTEYICVLFMIASSIPFIRYVQLSNGNFKAPLADSQIKTFLMILFFVVTILFLWLLVEQDFSTSFTLRKTLFNGVSILTGTGYSSDNYMLWGTFPFSLFLIIGLIGGCAGSTTCSIKVFRFQILFSAIMVQIKQMHYSRAVLATRYEGKKVSLDIISSVIAFFILFFVTLFLVTLALSLTGLDFVTSISGAVSTLANVGPGLGERIGPVGNYANLNSWAKLILIFSMFVGRLELMVVYVLFTLSFWRG